MSNKPTRQRTAVAAALIGMDGFVSAQTLHEKLRAGGESVGLTTVYRHLQALAEAGEADMLRTADGEAAYRQCGAGDHHHHLVCRSCGRAEDVTGPAVEAWADAVAAEHGFVDVSHTVEIFGTCAACARPTAGR